MKHYTDVYFLTSLATCFIKAPAFLLVLGGPIHKSAQLLKFVLAAVVIIQWVNDQLRLEIYSVKSVSCYRFVCSWYEFFPMK